MRKEGYIKWYIFEKGYGSLIAEINGQKINIFINYTQFKNTFSRFEEGDLVEFDLIYTSEGRPKATNIYYKK
jgi:cold shock CspA family protein